jgi:deoxyribodipyrimidine photo-lyase
MAGESIWWVRRDLRLGDNPALAAALEFAGARGGRVIPLFVLDPKLCASPYVGEKRLAFLFAGLHVLDASLRARGSYLVVRQGDPQEVLAGLIQASGAEMIFAEPDYSPYACQRDERVSRSLPVSWIGGPALRPAGSLLKADGRPYTVFTPFSKAWKALPGLPPALPLPAPERIPTPPGLETMPLPGGSILPQSLPFLAGEDEAMRRLERFAGKWTGPLEGVPIHDYALGRNALAQDGTAQLSPYLRFGMLSARQAVVAALEAIRLAADAQARQGAETWLNELIWREFYLHILYHFPQVRRENFRLPGVRWQNAPAQFAAWREGRTGYPVVDAAMRQLLQTGWMHNRARMIVASFLTKDLLIDWRWGERWFMQHLVDGDPAANNGGWQWTAGTGTDAAPYFRIFNPVSQGVRHDPQGAYIRRWVPELQNVPGEYIHQPWTMPAEVQRAAGCRIGQDYPAPVVDHGAAREKALEAYGQK